MTEQRVRLVWGPEDGRVLRLDHPHAWHRIPSPWLTPCRREISHVYSRVAEGVFVYAGWEVRTKLGKAK